MITEGPLTEVSSQPVTTLREPCEKASPVRSDSSRGGMYNEDILNLQFQEFNGKLCRATEYFSLVLKADNKFNPKFWRGHILCNHIYIITYTHSE